MSSPESEAQLCKVFFLKPSAIRRALVIEKGDHILISEDDGETWGSIPRNLVQGTIPIKPREDKRY